MVSLLALASKPLFEREVLALRSENELLRLRLFWKDYGVDRMVIAMKRGNSYPADSPYCQCQTCVTLERSVQPRKRGPLHGPSSAVSGDYAPKYDEECSFGPWFAAAAERFGLSVISYPMEEPYPKDIYRHDANTNEPVVDLDCHLVNMGSRPWINLTYGRRIWDARTADSPELAKLARFFGYLETYQLTNAPG